MALEAQAPSTSKETATSVPRLTGKVTGSLVKRWLAEAVNCCALLKVSRMGAVASAPPCPARARLAAYRRMVPSPARKLTRARWPARPTGTFSRYVMRVVVVDQRNA